MRKHPQPSEPAPSGETSSSAASGIDPTAAANSGSLANKEFARFLEMTIKSANETEGHLLSARDLDLFDRDEWQKFTAETIEICKMVYTYRKRVLETADAE